MPVTTQWYIEKRLLYQRFYGVMTIKDFRDSIQQITAFMEQGTPPIHTLTDVLEVEKWPSLEQLSQVVRREPYPGSGWTVVVVSNPVLRFVTSVLTQLTTTQMRSFSKVQNALDFLASRDFSIASELARKHDSEV